MINKVAAEFVTENWHLLLLPLVLFAVIATYITIWAFELVGLFSMGKPIK